MSLSIIYHAKYNLVFWRPSALVNHNFFYLHFKLHFIHGKVKVIIVILAMKPSIKYIFLHLCMASGYELKSRNSKNPGSRDGTKVGTRIFGIFKVPKTGYFGTGIWISYGIRDRDGKSGMPGLSPPFPDLTPPSARSLFYRKIPKCPAFGDIFKHFF